MGILKDILAQIPKEAQITSSAYEGSNIVFYTTNKQLFLDSNELVLPLVNQFKKRIEIRTDPSIREDSEVAEKKIEKILPESAKIQKMFFESARAQVTICVENPNEIIGNGSNYLIEIKEKTGWTPRIQRYTSITANITQNIHTMLYQDNDNRKKFLNSVGERIYEIRRHDENDQRKWIRLTWLGSAREVGRSCILLSTQESRVLLDCGINPASNEELLPYLDAPELNLGALDAVVITHAHMDHHGALPYLYKFGYQGPIYCTEPTRDIMALMQLDFIKISHSSNEKPLYDTIDIANMIKHCITLDWGEVTDITPDVRLSLYNAGHVLGSSMAHLHIGNGWHNILYTGDFKYRKTMLLHPAQTMFPRVETMIMESTYGGKDDIVPPLAQAEEDLLNYIEQIAKKKGRVLIPTFGIGRAQEVMLLISKNKDRLGDFPVFVDGMVWDISAIHSIYPRFMNQDVKKEIFFNENNPFVSQLFKKISAKERKGLIENKEPGVYLATSGMLTGGPSVEYLKAFADDPNAAIIFVGYQAENTVGAKVQREVKEVTFEGDARPTEIKLQIFTVRGLSGHSDRRELMAFVKNIKPKPKKIFINHGESGKCLDLATSIYKLYGIDTYVPKNLDGLRIK